MFFLFCLCIEQKERNNQPNFDDAYDGNFTKFCPQKFLLSGVPGLADSNIAAMAICGYTIGSFWSEISALAV